MEEAITPIDENTPSETVPRQPNNSYDATPVEAFVVPMPAGSATFFDSDLTVLASKNGLLRLDMYSPSELSAGELIYLQTEFEAQMISYAHRNTTAIWSWYWFAAIGVLDLLVLAGLILFILAANDRSFLLFAWAFAAALLPAPILALRVFSNRRKVKRGRKLLDTYFVHAGVGQKGACSASVKGIWDFVNDESTDRDFLTLERFCLSAGWSGGARFYRSKRMEFSYSGLASDSRFMDELLGRRQPLYVSLVTGCGL